MKKLTNKATEPVTQENLQMELNILKIDLKHEMNEMSENARQYQNDVLTKLDDIVGKIETLQEENTIGTYQTSNLQTAVDNHEERLARLEHKQ